MKIKDPLISDTLKQAAVIAGFMLVMRLTNGYFGIVMLVLGIWYAFTNNLSKSLMFYILYPFFAIMNGMICPQMPMFSMVSRIGTMAMTLSLVLSSVSRNGKEQLPLGGLFFYLLCAVISSMDGYCPVISYLKILNFGMFICGLYLGVRNIHHRPQEVYRLRTLLLAMAVILVFGSMSLLLVAPGLAYSTSVKGLLVAGSSIADANAVAANIASNDGMLLFAGITNQSQCLSPMLSALVGMTACDMVICEKRMSKLHLFIILGAVPLMYMTRSRTAFLALTVIVTMVYMYVMPKAKISHRLKSKINSGMYLMLGLLFVAMTVIEVRNHGITRLLRKTDDIAVDNRGFAEALTSSRMGKIEELMHDFRKNPLLGMGFQVVEEHQILYQMGGMSMFSAPIEKGVLPVMILGEGGVVGECAFLLFLIVFYSTCRKKRYIATATLFTVFLATNMAEATFFSPSGGGGTLWVICVAGGFVLDMYAKHSVSQGKYFSFR